MGQIVATFILVTTLGLSACAGDEIKGKPSENRDKQVYKMTKKDYSRLLADLKPPEFTAAWKNRATEVFLETERLLQKLQSQGFTYKSVRKIEPTDGCPFWSNGKLGVHKGKSADIDDLGYLAHEMGHGFHEKLREEKGYNDVYGEDWAEAIRYFVEKRMKTGRKSKSVVLEACEYDEDKFITMLKNGELQNKFGVK